MESAGRQETLLPKNA